MIRKAIRNTLIIAIFLLAPIGANAAFWIITDTVQNGTAYTPGFGSPGGATLGFVGWFTNGVSGGGNHNIVGAGAYAPGFGQGTDGLGTGAPTLGLVGWFTMGTSGGDNQNIVGAGASAPGYACYGLTVSGDTTCAAVPTPEIWSATTVSFSGSINDDLSFMDLSWTGQSGIEIPFGSNSLFTSTINSGSYDENGNISGGVDAGAGYDADGFSCWNNPLNGLPGPPDVCGNGTGVAEPAPVEGGLTKASRELPAGLVGFTDNMDGTITIDLWDSTYTDCANDGGCTPGSNSSDVFAQWRVNATVIPVPAAIWLFGSALGLLGWLRRKTA
jgi:hypothetical protein